MLTAVHPPPRLPSPLQEIRDERFARRGVRLLLKRDDLIHPAVPGNKWRKLAPNLKAAIEGGHTALVTFGGAYSNHLRATAAAGRMLRLATVGVVRGDELAARPLNHSLARCAADGMRLLFVSRADYRHRHDPDFTERLLHGAVRTGEREDAGDPPSAGDALPAVEALRTGDLLRNAFRIPEGGSNALAVRGCSALGEELRGRTDVAAVACGTGGTLAGLAAGLGEGQSALGIPVLRGGFLAGEVRDLQRAAFGCERGDWRLDERFHFGGYARTTRELDAFAAEFAALHDLPPLEPLYVAKLLFALAALTEEGAFAPGTTVTAVVTGPR
ncbi:1-aminocyclopropane-1-carboxylate deaminase/D-cysteine desulfhydrase [Streptomyces marispadix]|uniref:Pyridoxal-phosphate dependent enzyme n=1 Tax=Streptomyces marispadix TaxID=2922868 RepID=A0ABS9T1T1_9ACTN|nr:pyridoxal-phosphate dependent enzyme [Streptomyces marispadix]MCH6162480.1 pyridoxal-phosphate dependent enzyme [Streptomyces marispadix]